MPPGGLAEPGGSDINPSTQSQVEGDKREEASAQTGRESHSTALLVEPASHVATSGESSRYSHYGPPEELERRAISPHGEHIVTRGQPHYRREYPAFRSSASSSRSSLKSPLMGVEEFVGDRLSPRHISQTRPLRLYRGHTGRSRRLPRTADGSGPSNYCNRRKDARELFTEHGVSPPSGWLSEGEGLQSKAHERASPRRHWRICHVYKARIRSRTFCTSCGHPLCQTCTCPIPEGADEIHQDFLANRGAHLSIRSGEVYTSYPGSLPSSPDEIRQRFEPTVKEVKLHSGRASPAIRGRTTSVRDNPFVIADRITKARTAAAQATPVSVTANRKLSEYVPHSADYIWEPGVPTVSFQDDCNDPTCRATHEGHRPYRHSIGCTEYKEAHGKRPSEILEHVYPRPGEFAHQHQCPNTLETMADSEYQRSEDFYGAQHIQHHLAAAARWHTAHQAHTPRHNHELPPSNDQRLESHGTHITGSLLPEHLPSPESQPLERLIEANPRPEEKVNYYVNENIQQTLSPSKDNADSSREVAESLKPRSKVNTRGNGLSGSSLIRAKSPTSWLKKPATGASVQDTTLLKKVSSRVAPPWNKEEERLNFAELRSRLKHHDMDKPFIHKDMRPAPRSAQRMITPQDRAAQPQESQQISRETSALEHASKELLPIPTYRPNNSPGPEQFIVAPEPQRYQLYYAFSAGFEASPEGTRNEETTDSSQWISSASDSSRGEVGDRIWENRTRSPCQQSPAADVAKLPHVDGLVEAASTISREVSAGGKTVISALWPTVTVWCFNWKLTACGLP